MAISRHETCSNAEFPEALSHPRLLQGFPQCPAFPAFTEALNGLFHGLRCLDDMKSLAETWNKTALGTALSHQEPGFVDFPCCQNVGGWRQSRMVKLLQQTLQLFQLTALQRPPRHLDRIEGLDILWSNSVTNGVLSNRILKILKMNKNVQDCLRRLEKTAKLQKVVHFQAALQLCQPACHQSEIKRLHLPGGPGGPWGAAWIDPQVPGCKMSLRGVLCICSRSAKALSQLCMRSLSSS